MGKKQPPGGQAPVVQRVRVRYAKRGPLRFTSHRDFARAIERAIQRAGVPIAYSQGFTPHPKISFASAAPTGVASEAEYLELGLRERVEPKWLREALDAALSPGLDVLDAVEAKASGGLADRITASRWRMELPGIADETLSAAVDAFLTRDEVPVRRLMKQGWRTLDARAAVVRMSVGGAPPSAPDSGKAASCAILDLVVRQVTPSVRPDDVLSGLREVADLTPPEPRVVHNAKPTRLAQGTLTAQGEIVDPLEADRDGAVIGEP